MTNLKGDRRIYNRIYKKPIWLSTSTYYSICITVCLTLFLLLHFFSEDKSSIFVSTIFLTICILLREIFLRRSRNKFVQIQKQFPVDLKFSSSYDIRKPQKLTIEQNRVFLRNIERKSQAAKVLDKIPEAHFKVFQACDDYLKITEKELEKISINSPRLSPILRGRRYVMKLHKEHLLAWAELESKSLIQSSRSEKPKEKIRKAQEAVEKLKFALSYYPKEEKLIESIRVIHDIITSTEVSSFAKKAELAASRNQIQSAIEYYNKALSCLEKTDSLDKKRISENIRQEIEKLLTLQTSRNENKKEG